MTLIKSDFVYPRPSVPQVSAACVSRCTPGDPI
jgi:hypothetical protein